MTIFIKKVIALVRQYPKDKRGKVLKDYTSLYNTKGITTDEYLDFELDKRKESFRKTFLGVNEQRFYLDFLNPIKYYSVARNKYFTHKLLEKAGVRKTKLYCYYQPEGLYIGNTENANDLAGVLRILKQKEVQSCVIKTTESSHGDNVWVIKSISYSDEDAFMTRFDGFEMKLSSVLCRESLIFESVVQQTKQLSSFNSSSVNTLRFMTTLYPDGSARVIAVFMKIGRLGKCVDNAGAGGNIDACVDLETGEIKYAIQFDGWRRVKDIEKHPDSGIQLNGTIINHWNEIKSEVIRFQQAFPFCKAAGWDIALTEEGPVVVEVNDFWDRTGQFFIRRGWRKEIRDCFYAWQKTGKKYKMYRQSNALSLKHLLKIASYE